MAVKLIITVFLFCLACSSARACSVPPGPGQWEKSFRELIDESDYALIGRVGRILRTKWGVDDQMGPFELDWLKRRSEGGNIPASVQNRLQYSNAVADIYALHAFSKATSSALPFTNQQERFSALQVDLLRPFTRRGYGPCFSFPRTCPWRVQPGDFVAIAVNKGINPIFRAQYCVIIERPDRKLLVKVQTDLGSKSAGQIFRLFVRNPLKPNESN